MATQKDFLFLSPELQTALLAAEVTEDYFADHGILTGTFRLLQECCSAFTWRMPYHRKDVPPIPAWHAVPSIDPAAGATQRYERLWGQFEQRASSALVESGSAPLQPHEKGRARTRDTQLRKAPIVPPRRGRDGEIRPAFLGLNLKHVHCIRQLRRLQALKHSLQKGTPTSSALEYRASLWHAALHAPGFSSSFSAWYPSRSVMLPSDLASVPHCMPNLQMAGQLFLTFQANVDHLEAIVWPLSANVTPGKRGAITLIWSSRMSSQRVRPL